LAFPFHLGSPVRGLIPVGVLANGEVTAVEDTNTGGKRVFVRFHDGTESRYHVSKSGHCDYLSPGHIPRN